MCAAIGRKQPKEAKETERWVHRARCSVLGVAEIVTVGPPVLDCLLVAWLVSRCSTGICLPVDTARAFLSSFVSVGATERLAQPVSRSLSSSVRAARCRRRCRPPVKSIATQILAIETDVKEAVRILEERIARRESAEAALDKWRRELPPQVRVHALASVRPVMRPVKRDVYPSLIPCGRYGIVDLFGFRIFGPGEFRDHCSQCPAVPLPPFPVTPVMGVHGGTICRRST